MRTIQLTAFFLLLILLSTFYAPIINAAPVDSKGVILMNLDTREVIYAQNATRKIPPASLTKIMTMYLVFDAIKAKKFSYNTQIKISKNAADTPGSTMGIVAGESIPVKKLLLGMAVASGNDACVAMAEYMAGSEAKFTTLMNEKAKRLKLKNTTFKNSSGLPADNQFTTAEDMLALSRNYIMNHPEGLRYHSAKSMYHRGVRRTNKNPQLGEYEGADGLKTGWTRASGYNIVSTSRRGKVRLIAVVLGAQTSKIRAKELNRLMDAGFKSEVTQNASVYTILDTKKL